MERAFLFALSLAASCAVITNYWDDDASVAQADTVDGTTIFDALDDQFYLIPEDAPDELLDVLNPYYAREVTSLIEGTVTSVWMTTESPDGVPSAMVYRCAPVGPGTYRWVASAEAWLTPFGVPLDAYPDLLPFSATYTTKAAPSFFFGGGAGPVFTLDTKSRSKGGLILPAHSQFVGVEEVTCPGESEDDLPLARIRKVNGTRLGLYQDSSLDHADYVLRLHTKGGAGPGAGTECAPGDPEQRAPFDAELWFMRLGFVPAEKPSADGGTGGDDGGS
ncbi:MAG: DUF3455 domain-containing protein [Minicystis sp.]